MGYWIQSTYSVSLRTWSEYCVNINHTESSYNCSSSFFDFPHIFSSIRCLNQSFSSLGEEFTDITIGGLLTGKVA